LHIVFAFWYNKNIKVMNKKNTALIILSISVLFLLPLFASAVTINNPIKYSDFSSLLTAIAGAVATIIGSLAALMIIVSGFLFITSAGSPEKIKNAKAALTYAIIGMVVAGLASAIIATVKSVLST